MAYGRRVQYCSVWWLILEVGLTSIAWGQIVHDGTLGVGSAGQLPGGDHITISAQRGHLSCNQQQICNLFHSFSEFNINTGGSATFLGPAPALNVVNVLARVTGQLPSNIDGLLRSSGMPGANFFLINPNGVVFGPNARLDVGGSFAVTTANEVHLADGGLFAVAGQDDQLLTTAAPIAFGFLSALPGDVDIEGASLTVSPGQSVSVVSGGVRIVGGSVEASNGVVNLVSVGSEGQVALEVSNPSAQVELQNFHRLGEIQVTDGGAIDIDAVDSAAGHGGTLVIRAGKLVIDQSQITHRSSGSENGRAVDIEVSDQVTISHGGKVSVETLGSGNGAALLLSADRVALIGSGSTPTGLFSTVAANAQGDGGAVTVLTDHLEVLGGAAIESATNGTQGVGGSITVAGKTGDKALTVVVGDPDSFTASKLSSSAISQRDGSDGGHVSIKARSLMVYRGSSITSSAIGTGKGGDLAIEADTVLLDGRGQQQTRVAARSEAIGIGDPGGVGRVQFKVTDLLSVIDGAQISSTTRQLPNGGQIDIAAQSLYVAGTNTRIAVSDTTRGQATQQSVGLVSVIVPRVEVVDGAQISASTNNRNQGGTIRITAQDSILIDGPGSALIAGPQPGSRGKGGNIVIGGLLDRSGELLVTNGGKISVETQGLGDGGSITIGVDRATIANGASITSRSVTSGNAGQITMVADGDILVSNNATIQTSAEATQARGGDILLSAGTDVTLLNSEISATATGDGGNVRLTAFNTVELVSSDITAEAALIGGDIVLISASDVLLTDSTISAESDVNGGDVSVTAGSDIELDTSTVSALAGVDGGDVRLTALGVVLATNSEVTAAAASAGGAITVDARGVAFNRSEVVASSLAGDGGNISLESDSGLALTDTTVSTEAAANGGDIELVSVSDVLLTGSTISAESDVNGGDVSVTAGSDIELDTSTVSALAGVDGGDVRLTALGVVLATNSEVTAAAASAGGAITVDARGVAFNRSEVVASSLAGDGGNISLESDSGLALTDTTVSTEAAANGGDIELVSGSRLDLQASTVSAKASVAGGDIRVDALHTVNLQDSVVTAEAGGVGGTISVASDQLVLNDSGINASSLTGNGGGIALVVDSEIALFDSRISAAAAVNGGDVSLTAGIQILQGNSTVSAEAGLDGGDIELTASVRIQLVDSTLTGLAGRDGGQITLDPVWVICHDSVIDGRAGFQSVSVTIDPNANYLDSGCQILTGALSAPPELDLAPGLIAPPTSLADAQSQLQQHCAVLFGDQPSSFTVLGRGGTPVVPGRWQPSINLAVPTDSRTDSTDDWLSESQGG